ncbi:DUF3450 domain-containing protein [Vreelandella aquamarina]|uniref:DUF3450 domain-containing protein n=1 Tax=Vreelandella aquamarina TaxID=77097 RepID=UPI00384A5270
MLKRPLLALQGCWLAGVLASGTLMASSNIMVQEEQGGAPSAFQQQIEAADDSTRSAIEELRRLERDTHQLQAANAALSTRLVSEAQHQQRLERALNNLDGTRAALPEIEQLMREQLTAWINADLPFLKDERLARVSPAEPAQADSATRIAGLLEAWRAELAYGRAVDSWRGRLQPDEGSPRDVEFLRLGRIGLYYLTPDGRQGGVWDVESRQWLTLDETARREVRNGLRIADEQRTPELLRLPLSVRVEDAAGGQR